MDELQAKIVFASMLISLGKATYDEIHAFFSSDQTDDAVLASIMADVQVRIARREAPPSA